MLMALAIIITLIVIFFEGALAFRDDNCDIVFLIPAILSAIALGTLAGVSCSYFEEDFPAISSVIDIDSTEIHKVNDKVEYVIVKDKAGNTYKLEAAPQN